MAFNQQMYSTAKILMATKHSYHVSLTILFWDHLITLDEEVRVMWPQPWSANKILFFLNRYITPTQMLIQILDVDWSMLSEAACRHLYRLPWATALWGTALAELILILRTYALWSFNKLILALLGTMWAAHVSVMIVAVKSAVKYELPKGFTGCSLTSSTAIMVLFWTTPWFADTIIFLLTWSKTKQYMKQHRQTGLLQVLARDGFVFYFVIFGVVTVNILVFLLSDPGIKPMGGAFCQVLTTVMISRLQLNLRQHDQHGAASPRNGLTDEILPGGEPISKRGRGHILTTLHSFIAAPLERMDQSLSTLGTPVESTIFPITDSESEDRTEDIALSERQVSIIRGQELVLDIQCGIGNQAALVSRDYIFHDKKSDREGP